MADEVQLKIWHFSSIISSENITTTTAEIPYEFTYEIDCPRDVFPASPSVGDICTIREYSNQQLTTESPALFSNLNIGAENLCDILISASYDCTYMEYKYIREVLNSITLREDEDDTEYQDWELVNYYTNDVEVTESTTVKVFEGEAVELPVDAIKIGEGIENGKKYVEYQYDITSLKTYWFYDYELVEYYWSKLSEQTFLESISVIGDSIDIYTHPGTCDIWNDLTNSKRLKTEFITVLEVKDWLDHYKKWLSWNKQDSYYDADMSEYTPNTGDLITATWYNQIAKLVNVTTVNSGEQIKASHFTALSNAIS